MPTFDFVMAGGGLAAVSLACHLVRSPLAGASILIVDRDPAPGRDRLWSYWSAVPTVFDSVVARTWRQLHIASDGFTATHPLPGGRYELLCGVDVDRYTRQALGRHTQVAFRTGVVRHYADGPEGARLTVDGEPITARWVFDSTDWPNSLGLRVRPPAMAFKGWMVESAQPTFDPHAVTFLDTRTPQPGDLRFFYVLPFSPRRALVEYVVYSGAPAPLAEAGAALTAYLRTTLGLAHFTVAAEETGCLPLVAAPHPRRLGPHRLAIGARAGLVKPSTGFGLRRIEQDSAEIVRSLLGNGHPWEVTPVSRRHRLYDSLLLEVLDQRGEALAGIFALMFARNPWERVMRFLDETSSVTEDLQLIATLPPGLFLQAMPHWAAARGGQRPARRSAA